MSFETIKKLSLVENLELLKTYKISYIPADASKDKTKYFVLKPKTQSKNPILIIQNHSSDLNKDFYKMKYNENLQIGPLPLVHLKNFNLSNKSDEALIKNLIENKIVVQYDQGESVYIDETRPAPRQISSQKINLVKPLKAFSEDEIEEIYLSILRYIHPFCTIKKIGRQTEFKPNDDINELIGALKLQINEENKDELNISINLIQELIKLRNNLEKLYIFANQSLKQLQRLIYASSKIQDLNRYLGSENQIQLDYSYLFNFWLKNIFQEGLKSYVSQSPAEFNFFQIQNINIEKTKESAYTHKGEKLNPAVKIFIKHLEPFKTLPVHTSLLRVIADAVKTFSSDELYSSNFDWKDRFRRFEICYNQVKNFDLIDLPRLEYAKKVVFLGMYCDLIIDAQEEITNKNWFYNIENGVEIYTRATIATLKAVEKIIF